MSQSPLKAEGSKQYGDAWRAINILIRSDGTWSGRERNLCFRNRGDGTFGDISFTSGLDLDADGRAFVPLDLDGDGDLDLVVKNRNGVQLRAFRNDLRPEASRHLTIRLEGRRSNRDGVGSRVEVLTDRRTLTREIASGGGYLSQRSRVVRFGLPEGETVQRLTVRWPGGKVQQLAAPGQQGRFVLVEDAPEFTASPRVRPTVTRSEAAGSSRLESSSGTWLAQPVPAPDFELPTVGEQDASVRLSSLRGQQVLLNLWATWCPPCRRELALFQEQGREFERSGVAVIAVSVDDPATAEAVAKLSGELRLAFPVLLADRTTAEAYSILNERLFDRRRALAIPTSFLLDAEGRIVKVYRGEVDPAEILRDSRAEAGSPLPFSGRWVVSEPARDFEELAAAFAERGLGQPARRIFDEALARGQRSPGLLNNLAGALITEGDVERGEALLREALAAEPAMTDAKVNLAALLIERGSVPEAETLLVEALSEQPRDSQALSVLGSIRFSQGQAEEAEGLFRRAVAVRPDDARFRENHGAVLATLGRFEEALREYETARDLGSAGAPLQTNLAVLYMQTGKIDQARDAFLTAAELEPDSPSAHLNLARYQLQTNDLDAALASIRQARELLPGDPGPLVLQAQALALQGRTDEARSVAREALRLDPQSAEAEQILRTLP